MRKSIGALLGLVAVLSACGAPKLMTAPSAASRIVAAGRDQMDDARRLIDILRVHFKVARPSSVGLTSRQYGPAWGFITLAPHNDLPDLYQVYAGTISKDAKITTMVDFAGSYRVSRNAELEMARKAIRSHVTTLIGTEIKHLVIGKNPKGFDQYSYLAIGSNDTWPDTPEQDLTWFHAGTYSVKSDRISSIANIGIKQVP